MEVKGICSVCGKAAFMRTCVICGAQVCTQHFDPVTSTCSSCRAGRKI